MAKLLSQSKHEEFESNSALQIRDEKERRAENAENLELQEIPERTVHAHGTVHLFLTLSCFCYNSRQRTCKLSPLSFILS